MLIKTLDFDVWCLRLLLPLLRSFYHFPIMTYIVKEKSEMWCNNIEIWVEKTRTLALWTHLSRTSQNGVCSICIGPVSLWFAFGCERLIWKRQVEELWNFDWMAPPADQHQHEKEKKINLAETRLNKVVRKKEKRNLSRGKENVPLFRSTYWLVCMRSFAGFSNGNLTLI